MAGNNEFLIDLDLSNLEQLEQKLQKGLKVGVSADLTSAEAEIKKLQTVLTGITSKTLVKLPTQQRLDAFVAAMKTVQGLGNLNLNLDVKLPTEARLNAFVTALQQVQTVSLTNLNNSITPLSASLQSASQAAVTLFTAMKALQNLQFGTPKAPNQSGPSGVGQPPGKFQEVRSQYDSIRYGGTTFRTPTQINREDRAFADAQKEIERRLGEVNFTRLFGGDAQGKLDEIKTDVGRRFDFPTKAFKQQLSDVKLFNLKNLTSPEAIKHIGAAGLIGGNLFSTAGAAVATGAFGPEAAFVGGQVGEKVGRIFEGITRAMEGTIEKGVEYQRSINSIAAVLNQTTVTVRGGTQLSGTDSLLENFAQAREIQNLARKQLLPLGVSGESEAALVSGTVSALGSRGISASAKQFANISSNIGAGVAALAPDLISNPTILRRDVEDIVTGSPRATQTALGIRLKGFAPELFGGNLKSADDFERATEKLKKLAEVITSNGDGAAQLTRTFSLLNNAATIFGDGLLKGLEPTLKKLNEVLGNKDLSETFEKTGEAVGKTVTGLVEFVQHFGDFGRKLVETYPHVKDLIDLLSRLGGKGSSGQNGTQNKDGSISFVDGKGNVVSVGKDGTVTKGPTAGTAPKSKNVEANNFAGPDQNIKTLVDRFGLGEDITKVTGEVLKREEDSAGLKRRGLDLIIGGSTTFPNALKNLSPEQRTLLLGARTKVLKDEVNEGKGNFDLSSIEGQVEFGKFALPLQQRRNSDLLEILGARRENVAKAQSVLDEAQKADKGDIGSESKIFAASRDLQKATQLQIDAEKELTNARRDSFKTALSLGDAEANKIDRERAARNPFTIGEQRADIDDQLKSIELKLNNRRRALLGASNEQAGGLENEITGLEAQQRGALRGKTSKQIENDRLTFGLADTKNNENVVALKARQSLEQFADSVIKADRALTDFSENARLRSLGRQGETIAAAKSYLAAGGDVSSLPVDVQQLLSTEGDVSKRLAFENLREVRKKNSLGRTFDDDFNTANALSTNLALVQAEYAGQPVKNALQSIDLQALKISQQQLLGQDARYDRSALPNLGAERAPLDSDSATYGRLKLNEAGEKLDAVRQHLKSISKNTTNKTGGDFDGLTKNDIAEAVMTGSILALKAEFA